MKTIFQNADHMAATEQLTQLSEAHAAAMFEESALLAQLNDQPYSKPSALDRAKAMLTGGTPAPRQDHAGLLVRLTACRETLALLTLAITEQRGIMAGLVQAQSAVINADRKASHIKAAERIKTALAGLRDALLAEQALRAEIEAGGYQCSLEPLVHPALNQNDPESGFCRFERDVNAYLLRCEIESKTTVNVRLLYAKTGSLPGDVLSLPGHEAAAMIHIGHGEITSAKPSRVTRPVRESFGLALS